MRDRAHSLLSRTPATGVGPALTWLCQTAVDEHRLAGVVVTLMSREPGESPGFDAGGEPGAVQASDQAVAAFSDATTCAWEELQFSLGEGPGSDTFRSGRPVLVAALSDGLARWPGYVPVATEAGIGAVFTFPIQFGAVRFGVLSCYDVGPRSLAPWEITSLLVFAESATELLLDSTPNGSPGAVDPDLQSALHVRTEVYQAQGMVMVQLGISLTEALARMRARAFATEVSLAALALGILEGSVLLARDAEAK